MSGSHGVHSPIRRTSTKDNERGKTDNGREGHNSNARRRRRLHCTVSGSRPAGRCSVVGISDHLGGASADRRRRIFRPQQAGVTMTIEFRRYVLSDIPPMINKLEQDFLRNIDPKKRQGFSRDKVTDLLTGNVNNTLFHLTVAVNDGEVIGALCASVYSFIFSYEAIALDHLFYVDPDHRSVEVATGLVSAYVEWAKARKVVRAELRNVTGKDVGSFSKLATKLGFKLIGTFHAMEL